MSQNEAILFCDDELNMLPISKVHRDMEQHSEESSDILRILKQSQKDRKSIISQLGSNKDVQKLLAVSKTLD